MLVCLVIPFYQAGLEIQQKGGRHVIEIRSYKEMDSCAVSLNFGQWLSKLRTDAESYEIGTREAVTLLKKARCSREL